MTAFPSDSSERDLGAVLVAALIGIGGSDRGLVPFALGWATVDLERAERAFAQATGVPDGTFGEATDGPDDLLLGARCRIVRPRDPRMPIVVLLEPATEGRLAAALARHGEGPAAAWLRALPTAATASLEGMATAPPRSAGSPGPFGLESLLSDGPSGGPHRLLVTPPPGTITP